MFRDVTFGQYYPTQSFLHSMDARVKILLCILFMVGIFFVTSLFGYALVFVFLALCVICSKVPVGSVLKSVKGILFFLLFTSVLNLFFTKGKTLLVQFWVFEIYAEGIVYTAKIMLRIVFLVMGSSVLTLTTTPVDMTHALESLLKPLRIIHFPAHEIALIMSLTLSFIPSLIDETDRIIRAQKARGADFDTGGLIKRAKAFVPILIPLMVTSMHRAAELASAMNSRCYEGATNRTKMHVMKLGWRDFVGTFVEILFFAAIFTLFAMQDRWQEILWLYY